MEKLLENFIQSYDHTGMYEFIKNVPFDERVKMLPYIDERIKSRYVDKTMDDAKQDMYCHAKLYCTPRELFDKMNPYSFDEVMDYVIPAFEPGWFNDFINSKQFTKTIMPDNYLYKSTYPNLLKWADKGYIHLSASLASLALWANECDTYSDLTFKEHIWSIFTLPHKFTKESMMLFGKLIQTGIKEGKIEPLRIVEEVIQVPALNKPKTSTEAIMHLLKYVKVKDEELLALQSQILQNLNNPYNNVVDAMLTLIVRICKYDEFNINEFINYLPVIAGMPFKGILKKLIDICDILLTEKPFYSTEVLIAAGNVFLFSEKTIQQTMTELILKHGDCKNVELCQSLTGMKDCFMASTKLSLTSFIITKDLPEETENMITGSISLLTNKIKRPVTLDDFFFWLAQYIEKPRNHNELFLELLMLFSKEISGTNMEQLEPIMKQIGKKRYSLSENILPYRKSIQIFLKYITHLIDIYPEKTSRLKKLSEQSAANLININVMGVFGEDFYDEIYTSLLNKETLPILSTPTHQPVWIDPEIFINRLLWYDKQNKTPDLLDMQVAIMRLVFENKEKLLSTIKQLQNIEYRSLLLYLFNEREPSPEVIDHKAWWITAALARPDRPDFRRFVDENYKQEITILIDNLGSVYYSNQLPYALKLIEVLQEIESKEECYREKYIYLAERYIPWVDFSKKKEVLEAAESLKTEEFKAFIYFLYEGVIPDKKEITYHSLWTKAAFYRPERPDPTFFMSKPIPYSGEYHKAKNGYSFILQIPEDMLRGKHVDNIPLINHIYSHSNSNNNQSLLFNKLFDTTGLSSYTPNNTDVIVRSILNNKDERVFYNTLADISGLQTKFSVISQILLAHALNSEKKEYRYFASECMLEKFESGLLDPVSFGLQLGKIVAENYLFPKRFVELIYMNMQGISQTQKNALCLSETLWQMQYDFPKILLGLYEELLLSTGYKIDEKLLAFFDNWKKIIRKPKRL
ncbi:MAG: DUF6493 family protein [Tannerellaceae bacterium]|nr:DUF6493 family protein [Tannerellaceae bacterium]